MKGGKYEIKEATPLIEEYKKTIDELDIYEPLNIFDFSKKYDEQPQQFKDKIKEEQDKLNNIGLDSKEPPVIKNLSLRFLIEGEIEKIEDGIKDIENYFDKNSKFTKKEGVEKNPDMEELLRVDIVEGYYEYLIIIRDNLFKSSNSKLQEKITEEDDKEFIKKSLVELKNPTKSEEPEKIQKDKQEKQSIISEEKGKKEESDIINNPFDLKQPLKKEPSTEGDFNPFEDEKEEKKKEEEQKNTEVVEDKKEEKLNLNEKFKHKKKGYEGTTQGLINDLTKKLQAAKKRKDTGKEQIYQPALDKLKNATTLPEVRKIITDSKLTFGQDSGRLKGGDNKKIKKITKTKKKGGKRTKKRTFKSKLLIDI
jgi:hypothetical protein